MNVLITADAIGGVWTYALDLACGLARHDVAVTLAVLGPPPSPEQRRAAASARCRLEWLDLPLDWMATTPAAVEGAGADLARFAAACSADHVLLHSAAYAAGGAFQMPVAAVCHSCLATWWDAVESGPLPIDLAWHRTLVGRGARRTDVLLAPTRSFAADTARLYGLARPPLVVHNGRQADRDAGPAPAAPAAAVIGAGRIWDRGKNFAALDRVAERLSIPVLAAGAVAGPQGERVETRHLRLLGRLDAAAMAARLRTRPIFASLALYEPFGLAVLEAAQAGCALVLSDRPGFRELWDDAAIFVDPWDDAQAALRIEALAADPAARAELGERARIRASRYSVDAMTDGVLAAFAGLPASRCGVAPRRERADASA